jgi:hypothetical protein
MLCMLLAHVFNCEIVHDESEKDWAVSIPQNSSWDKLRGDSLCERVGTLKGDGLSVIGVTTLGGNHALEMSCV